MSSVRLSSPSRTDHSSVFFNKPPRISFLDFPAEVRNIIYSYAIVMPFVIRNGNTPYRNDRKPHDRITACFAFMQTCRQVHEEASPMFWECNVFLLQAQAVEALSFQDNVTSFHHPLCPTDRSFWHVRMAAESPGQQQKIKRVFWMFGHDFRSATRNSKDWRLQPHAPSLFTSGPGNITELSVVLDVAATSLTRFPPSQDVEEYIERL